MAPFSFLLAIARYVQRSSAVSFTILNRVRAASLLETINCHASERARNEKRQKLERRGLRRRRLYYIIFPVQRARRYCVEQCDTFAVTAASRRLIRTGRRGPREGLCHC